MQHAATLQDAFVQLRDWVEETAARLEARVGAAEQRMDGCVAHTSLVRYDAMNELSGQQSSTVALLDSRRTGIVISSILHRDQARFYVKQLREGNSEFELSPEEQQAVAAALAGDRTRPPRREGRLPGSRRDPQRGGPACLRPRAAPRRCPTRRSTTP